MFGHLHPSVILDICPLDLHIAVKNGTAENIAIRPGRDNDFAICRLIDKLKKLSCDNFICRVQFMRSYLYITKAKF